MIGRNVQIDPPGFVKPMTGTRYIIELRARRHPTPADQRLKQALKLLGRAFAFEAVKVREVDGDDDRLEPAGAGPSGGFNEHQQIDR